MLEKIYELRTPLLQAASRLSSSHPKFEGYRENRKDYITFTSASPSSYPVHRNKHLFVKPKTLVSFPIVLKLIRRYHPSTPKLEYKTKKKIKRQPAPYLFRSLLQKHHVYPPPLRHHISISYPPTLGDRHAYCTPRNRNAYCIPRRPPDRTGSGQLRVGNMAERLLRGARECQNRNGMSQCDDGATGD